MIQRIKSSIFLKMFFNIALILMLASLFIYGIVMVATPQSYQKETDQRFSKSVEQLAEELKAVPREEGEQVLINFCIKNRAAVSLESDSEMISYGDPAVLEKGAPDENGISLMVGTFVQFADSDTSYKLASAQEGKVEQEMTAVFSRLLPWVVLIIIIVSVTGAFLCSRILSKPVLEVSRISKRMSELDMTWHCDLDRTDEIGMLAASLNTMAEKLKGAMDELENVNRQLQSDIEKEKAQERQRRAFFAAVSHELKTPITILKGQIESMIYEIGDYKNKEKYLPLALETAERMEIMVKEILTVSKLTADGFQLTLRPLDIGALVQDCLRLYQPLALKKKMELDYRDQDVVIQSVDKKLFEKAISNIISNAILYSPAGEKVSLTLRADALTIVNTGAHIPEEKLPELFAPLTRVEESRNKHTGGSGLGLYIVKTILDLHGLSYGIENREDGVAFTILLNLNQN